MKFHENPSSGSRVVACGQTDMTKLIVTFRDFVNVLKNFKPYSHMGFVVGTVSLGQVFALSPQYQTCISY